MFVIMRFADIFVLYFNLISSARNYTSHFVRQLLEHLSDQGICSRKRTFEPLRGNHNAGQEANGDNCGIFYKLLVCSVYLLQ